MPLNRFIFAILLSLPGPIATRGQEPGQTAAGLPVQGNTPIPGATAAPAKDEPPTDAEKVIDATIVRLKGLKSVSAEVEQDVDMLGQKFAVKGVYLKAAGNRVYLKLSVSGLGDTSATTLQVSDGSTLWEYQQVLESQKYVKLTLTQILKKLNDPILDPALRDQMTARIGLAGPETMLAGLRKTIRFDQSAEESRDGKKFWVIRGQWKDRSGLTAPGQPPIPATAPLPPYIPGNVAVWIGQDDAWPYRIEMYGNPNSMLAERRYGPDGRPIGGKVAAPKVEPSQIKFRYANVKLNPDLPNASFAWQPPADARGIVDGTDELSSFLDQAIQAETLRKKAEAAKGEPLLGGGIGVPKPSDAAPAPHPAADPATPTPTPTPAPR